MIIIEITKSLNSNRKLSKLRDVIKKKVLKYIEMRKEEILHLFIEASEFEEFEIDLLIRKQKPTTRQDAITT
jgi:S-adenosylmethionine:diacylglycerol 3-amino-3-carboxypropyl transferase